MWYCCFYARIGDRDVDDDEVDVENEEGEEEEEEQCLNHRFVTAVNSNVHVSEMGFRPVTNPDT